MNARRILAGAAVAAVVLWPAPRAAHTPADCARALGISYSVEQGATEHLNAFGLCLETVGPVGPVGPM